MNRGTFITLLMILHSLAIRAEPLLLAPELHIDPFENPLETDKPEEKTNRALESITSETATAEGDSARKGLLWQPDLRGIIRSEDIAIANIGGDMIELGEEYQGFRLIKVKERSVVFEKNGKQYPVSLDGIEEDETL